MIGQPPPSASEAVAGDPGTDDAERWHANWDRLKCFDCDGHGQVSSYTCGGMDFNGPDECQSCGGSGAIWRSKKGVLAQYPGGPFLGRETMKAE